MPNNYLEQRGVDVLNLCTYSKHSTQRGSVHLHGLSSMEGNSSPLPALVLREPLLPRTPNSETGDYGSSSNGNTGWETSPLPSQGVYQLVSDSRLIQPEYVQQLSTTEASDRQTDLRTKGERVEINFKYILEEARMQISIAGPMVLVNLFQYAILMVSMIFTGHLGELELAGSSLAISIASVLGFYVMLGMASALETLCGQAYGAKQYSMLGVHLQRALVVLLVACVPLIFLFFYMESLLRLVGQTPEISAKAGEYAIWLLPALYAYAFLQPLVKFLQAQSVVVPMVVCSGITLALHVGFCWFIIFKLGLGYPGAALTTSISCWLNVVLLVVYVGATDVCKDTWTGFSREAFTDLKTFLKLAAASASMICLEYWSFEVMVMLAGLLPNPSLELSALSVCLSTVTLNYMVPFGLSAAGSTRVSNELGAGRPDAARLAVYVVVGLSLCQALLVCSTLLLAHNVWGWVFSNDPEVVEYVSTIIPMVAILALFDGIQGVLSGVIRGVGRQDLGAVVNLGAFYGVGLPVGVVLAFHFRWAGKGIVVGLMVGLGLQMLSLATITFFTNWIKQAEKVSARRYQGGLDCPEAGSKLQNAEQDSTITSA